MPDGRSGTSETGRTGFWRELLIAVVMGLGTLASGWSSYQSALWDGIQIFRLADYDGVGREVAVKEVELGQKHVLDLFLLERFLDARDDGDSKRAAFLFGRLPSELQSATETLLDSRPRDNPDAARSPFHLTGYAQAGVGDLEALRKKRQATYDSADQANRVADAYTRLTVFFGLAMFLAGISAVMKDVWPRRGLIAGSVVVLAFSAVLLQQMPLAAN